MVKYSVLEEGYSEITIDIFNTMEHQGAAIRVIREHGKIRIEACVMVDGYTWRNEEWEIDLEPKDDETRAEEAARAAADNADED